MEKCENRLRKINELNRIKKHKKSDINEELLDLFATYIYTNNPDYKYNETYLKDKIPRFWDSLGMYQHKLEIREKIENEIKKNFKIKDFKINIRIVIDETWELNYNVDDQLWKKIITDNPKINSINHKETYIQSKVSDGSDIYVSDYNNLDDDQAIIDFVIDSIKKAQKLTGGR